MVDITICAVVVLMNNFVQKNQYYIDYKKKSRVEVQFLAVTQ